MALLDSDRFNNLKERIKAECAARCYTGSVAEYGGRTFDFSLQPDADKRVLNEHIKKIIDPLAVINHDLVSDAFPQNANAIVRNREHVASDENDCTVSMVYSYFPPAYKEYQAAPSSLAYLYNNRGLYVRAEDDTSELADILPRRFWAVLITQLSVTRGNTRVTYDPLVLCLDQFDLLATRGCRSNDDAATPICAIAAGGSLIELDATALRHIAWMLSLDISDDMKAVYGGDNVISDEALSVLEGAVTLLESRPRNDQTQDSVDCASLCTGMCYGNCAGSCVGGCGSDCTGGCTGGCLGCSAECANDCTTGCRNTCRTYCSGCSGCSGCGGCGSTCSGSCSGGCKGSCSGSCNSSCTVTCGGNGCAGRCTSSCSNGCTTGCGSSCGSCSGNCSGVSK